MKIRRIVERVISVVLLVSVSSPAQDKIPTNEQIVINSIRDALVNSECCKDMGNVRLDLAKTGPARPISSGLAEGLRELGNSVSIGPGDSSIMAGYDILGFKFVYRKGKSRGFLRQNMIRRAFDARIRVTTMQSSGGKIVGQNDITVNYVDEVDPAAADLIKSLDIPELSPSVPGSGWTRIIEPVVVTAAIGGLIYLFFANR